MDAFAPTLEEFVEALRGWGPGEFVEAPVVEPLTVDEVRQRLEQAAERLQWRLTWAQRAPQGVVRFRIEAAPVRAPTTTGRPTPSRQRTPALMATPAPAPGDRQAPRQKPPTGTPGASRRHRAQRRTAPSTPPPPDTSAADIAPVQTATPSTEAAPTTPSPAGTAASSAAEGPDPWPDALAEAITQFGGQAKEAEIGSWLRMRRPALANATSDLSARIRATLRSYPQFRPAGKRGMWRVDHSSTVARTPQLE